jgi:hypothetical protein
MSSEQIQEQLRLLEIEQRRLKQQRELLEAADQLDAAQQAQLENIKQQEKENKKLVQREKDRLDGLKTYTKEFESFGKKFRSMSTDVQNQLKGTNSTASVYLNLGKNIADAKKIQVELANAETEAEKEALIAAQQRESLFTEVAMEQAAQAKATQKAEDDLRGVAEVQQRINEILRSNNGLTQQQKQELIEGIKATEASRLKQERINTILEEQKGLFDALPESIKESVGFAKKLGGALTSGALPMVLLASVALAALSSFTKLDEAAKEFRETTGLTNSQMEGIRSQANEITGTFANLGVEAKDVFNTIAGLKAEFSDVAQFSDEVVAGLTVMTKNFGVSAESAAKVQGIFEQVGGLSSETATSLGLQVTQMANLAGVAPAKIMEDIAQSAEIASTLFRGDTVALAKNAIEARRLGTNLQSVASTAEKLLDFESGIGDELVAATFVGGQFNLNRARALAFEGKIVEAQKEVLAQVQRTGDFRQKDYFTQQQLAKAAGMSVEEINKQLNAQEKLNYLSVEEKKLAEDAIKKGLDISNINKEDLANQVQAYSLQQEQQATLEQISNQFMGIASTIGSALVPVLEIVATMLSGISNIINLFDGGAEKLTVWQGILGSIALLWAGISAYTKLNAMRIAGMAALENTIAITKRAQLMFDMRGIALGKVKLLQLVSQAALWALANPIAALAGIAAAAVVGGLAYNYLSKAGDMYSPASGKTVVSTKEGGLFELSPNDDLVAAPGIASKMGGGGTSVGNLGILSAPLNALLTEIKGLRADLNSGKVAVYMDTSKVTSTISRKVDQGTRNNFTLGTT